MDEYFLNKDDWDAMVELGVGEYRDEIIAKNIPSTTKSAFTRMFVFPPSFRPPSLPRRAFGRSS
jgi:hypothetical protein